MLGPLTILFLEDLRDDFDVLIISTHGAVFLLHFYLRGKTGSGTVVVDIWWCFVLTSHNPGVT